MKGRAYYVQDFTAEIETLRDIKYRYPLTASETKAIDTARIQMRFRNGECSIYNDDGYEACPYCGEERDVDWNFCPNCGQAMIE